MAKATSDKLRLSFDQQPAIAEYLQEHPKKPGDPCKMEVLLQFVNSDEKGVDFNIVAAVPEGYEAGEETEPSVQTGGLMGGEAPITAASMMVKRKKEKGGY